MRHFPLPMPLALKATETNLAHLDFTLRRPNLRTEYTVPGDDGLRLVVTFDKVETFRVLDEMAISVEAPLDDGLVPYHVAYRVEDGVFWRQQSETFRAVHRELTHYQFITDDACLDVLSYGPPAMTIEPAED